MALGSTMSLCLAVPGATARVELKEGGSDLVAAGTHALQCT